MRIIMDIGKRMKELRIQYGLTQQELADRSELTKGFISQLERNQNSPSIGRDFALKNKNPCSACEFQAKQGISIWGIKLLFFSV